MAIEQVKQELNELKCIEALKRCGIQPKDLKRLQEKYDKLLSKFSELDALILVKHIYYGEPYYKIGMDLNYSEEGIKKRYRKIVDKLSSLIDQEPTEDVVPRSEVEELQKKLKDYERVVGKLSFTVDGAATLLIGENVEYIDKRVAEGLKNMAVKQAKQEVAREIFEEFECHISTGIRILKDCINDTDAEQVKRHLLGRLHELCGMEKFIAELKKKYIGE